MVRAIETSWIVEPAYTNYTTIDGLSLNKVNHLASDPDGSLWIATDNGLDLFNGAGFEKIAAAHQRVIGIEKIYRISESEILIFGEDTSVYQYDQRSKSQNLVEKHHNIVIRFNHFSRDGVLVVVDSKNRVLRYNSGKFEEIGNLGSKKYSAIICRVDICWVALEQEIYAYDLNDHSYAKVELISNTSNGKINYLTLVDDDLYIGDDLGQLRIRTESGDMMFVTDLDKASKISSILVDSELNTWIGTKESGLIWIPRKAKKHYRLTHSQLDRYSLPNDRIHSIVEDTFGVIWVATDRGLAKLDIPRMEMGHIRYNNGPFGLVDRDFSAIYELRTGSVLIGNRESLTIYSSTGERLERISNSLLYQNPIFAFYQIASDEIWLGTKKGLLKFHLSSREVSRPFVEKLLTENTIYAISSHNEWLILGTSSKGVIVFNEQLGIVRVSREIQRGLMALTEVNMLYTDSTNDIWILHTAGIAKLDNKSLQYSSLDIQGIRKLDVTAMAQIDESKYWIGTKGKGLFILDILERKLEPFKNTEKIRNTYVNGMLSSGNQTWVSLDNSLIQIDNDNLEVKNYSLEDGLQDHEFNLALTASGNNRRLYFGGAQGVNVFSPEKIFKPRPKAIPRLEIKFNNQKELHRKRLSEIHQSQFPMTLRLLSRHTIAPGKNRVRYKINGVDPNWRYSKGPSIEVPVHNLGEGEYELTVQASGFQSDWSSTDVRWQFRVSAYWWKTKWAFFIYSLLSLVMFYCLYSLRVKHLKKKALILEETVEKRTAEIADQKDVIEQQYKQLEELSKSKEHFFENISHEIKTPLTLILGPAKKLNEKYQNAEDAKLYSIVTRNAKKVLDIVEQLLTISRLKSGLLEFNLTSVRITEMLLSKLREFNYLAEENNIELTQPNAKGFQILANRDSLDKILNNLLSNGIKYNRDNGYLKVSITQLDNQIEILFSNSIARGTKFETEQFFKRFYREQSEKEGCGIGLAFTRDLVNHNGGEITAFQSAEDEITFSLRFKAADQVEEQSPDTRQFIETQDNPRILLIEDDDDMRFYIRQELKEFELLTAVNGVEGVNLAKSKIPDVIISDVMMPELDGYGVVQELTQNGSTQHIPIILLTAKSSLSSKLKGLEVGAIDYLKKPFDANELRLRITNLLKLQAYYSEQYQKLLLPNQNQRNIVIDRDREFINLCLDYLQQNYTEPAFDGKALANLHNLSARQLQRKIKAIFNLTPMILIREFRLKKAAEELLQGFDVTATCFNCGFNDTAHFSRSFKQKYYLTPTEYKNKK